MRIPFLIILFYSLFTQAQELPPVINYSPNDYGAGNQNWMITQDSEENIYIANGTGLLEFTGEKWNSYPVPNNTIVRSVIAIKDRIYTGAYMEIGFWEHNEFGNLEYTSINDKFPVEMQVSVGTNTWE